MYTAIVIPSYYSVYVYILSLCTVLCTYTGAVVIGFCFNIELPMVLLSTVNKYYSTYPGGNIVWNIGSFSEKTDRQVSLEWNVTILCCRKFSKEDVNISYFQPVEMFSTCHTWLTII